MLTDYMRECIEIWEDEKLFRQMSREARRSGRKESEAVDIVRDRIAIDILRDRIAMDHFRVDGNVPRRLSLQCVSSHLGWWCRLP